MLCGSASLTLWTFGVWEDAREDFRARTLLAGRPSGPAIRTALSVRLSYQLFDPYIPANVQIATPIFASNGNNYLKNNPKLEHNGLIKRGALAVTSRPNVRGKLSCFNATRLAAYLKSREGRGAFNNADPCAACCAFFGRRLHASWPSPNRNA